MCPAPPAVSIDLNEEQLDSLENKNQFIIVNCHVRVDDKVFF